MRPGDVIFVAGRHTARGAALLRELQRQGFDRVLADEPDLGDATAVAQFFDRHAPAYILVVAGRSGGILTNQKQPATLMLDNLRIATNVLDAAQRPSTRRLLYVASSCIYPRLCPQPMAVEALGSGPLEPTSAPYALAKLAGVVLCQAIRRETNAHFSTAIAADVFGPDDEFSADDSHVLGALLRRFHDAQTRHLPTLEIWGSGQPRREFLYADDFASACVFVLNHYDGAGPINLGGGTELSIRELAEMIQQVVGYTGELRFDTGRPDGMPRKLLDSRPLRALGWTAQVSFCDALARTYQAFLEKIPAHVSHS